MYCNDTVTGAMRKVLYFPDRKKSLFRFGFSLGHTWAQWVLNVTVIGAGPHLNSCFCILRPNFFCLKWVLVLFGFLVVSSVCIVPSSLHVAATIVCVMVNVHIIRGVSVRVSVGITTYL